MGDGVVKHPVGERGCQTSRDHGVNVDANDEIDPTQRRNVLNIEL